MAYEIPADVRAAIRAALPDDLNDLVPPPDPEQFERNRLRKARISMETGIPVGEIG